MNGAPADAATSRSPVASMTILPMIACRAALALADDANDAAVLDDCARKPAVEPDIDFRLSDHRVGRALEAVGIERGGVADRLGL